MKPLLPLAVLLAVMIAGCSKREPYAKYRDAEIDYGMSKKQIRNMLGQPDDIEIVAQGTDVEGFDEEDGSTRRDLWNYGPFGAYQQLLFSDKVVANHITKYRLQVMFVGDKVVEWTKSAPLDEQPRHL